MKAVQVRVFATLRRHLPDERGVAEVEIEQGETVDDVCQRLGLPAEEVKTIFINNRKGTLEQVLSPGDRLSMFPPIAGG